MEGIVTVGPELAVVVVNEEELRDVTFGRAAGVEASEETLEEDTPEQAEKKTNEIGIGRLVTIEAL